jgi:hypothetical protein
MRVNRLGWVLKFFVMAVVFVAVVSLAVMVLWNWLAPSLFGWPVINLAQAAGLLLLCRMLLGGWLGRGGMHWRRRWAERWEQMSPEERERFRAGMRGRCGRQSTDGPQTSSPAAPTQ